MVQYPTDFAERIYDRDKVEFSLGDSLDVKLSIVLVALTFLAGQSANLIAGQHGLTLFLAFCQAGALLSVVCGGICVVIGLWPRNYSMETTPDELEQWFSNLKDHFRSEPESRAMALKSFKDGILDRTRERIAVNQAINATKSGWLYWSFFCTLGALTLNVIATVMRLF